MTPTPSVLILGARGRFGLAAVQAFSGAGWKVTAQCRPGAAPLPAVAAGSSVQWLRADVADLALLVAGAGRVDVVVHAMNPEYTTRAWRVQAPRLMAAAIDASRALGALLMFPGNVYNFGDAMPQQLQEDTLQSPTTGKGVVRVQLEQQLEAAFASHGVRSVVVRAGDFFGSNGDTLFDRVIAKDLRQGRMGWMGAAGVRTPWAYVPDLAATFERVAARRQDLAGAQVLHFAGHTLAQADWREALAGIARSQGWVEVGSDLKVVGLPWPLIRLGGLVMPTWASMAEMRYLWRTPHALDNSRLLALIGQEPHTPLAAAAAQSLAAMGLLTPANRVAAA